ncbi:hypothetical protein [Streptomyces sp. M41(2017)]|uniref:hypothetical protein n=1 Tax=unclassified Streptomyces TaxID=2593676 RepID=UPI0009BCABB7|nr:hypothetical protein [Streptomyces sp. M41(2017)]OQQ14397.1 hypothetical protein B0675_30100 [Streptomyces sp. M41(2017)]
MPIPSLPRAVLRGRTALDRAETALVEEYSDLVRLAYLTLPPSLNRHRRILVAHSLVQRSLPGPRERFPRPHVPTPRGTARRSVAENDRLRAAVLRSAIAYGRSPRGWPRRLPPPRTLLPSLPVVWGLRLFPRAGGAEEIALGQALSGSTAAGRAAFVLRSVDGRTESAIRTLLRAAGVADPEGALRSAARLGDTAGKAARTLLRSREFDACTVQTAPTDLLRRRRRFRVLWGALSLVVLSGVLLAVSLPGSGPSSGGRVPAGASLPGPADLVRTPSDSWADTSRVDFTAWPARGARADDQGLLRRALSAWARPGRAVRVSTTATTSMDPPPRAPRLLYAGNVDGDAVVLLHDGQRVVRYSEPVDGRGRDTLALARTDDADVTTAAALVVGRGPRGTRFLLAPWIAEARTRDLMRPDSPARPVDVARDGVTGPLSAPSGGAACDRRPVLQLRSSERIVEKHAFLLTDLGELSPVHLTYTPLPGHGTPPARQPREATGTPALIAWAHMACGLEKLRGGGVREVNAWDFAEQDLPENGGHAVWACARAGTWRGPGDVRVLLRLPASSPSAPAREVARARSTAACSRFGQHVVADAHWRSRAGHWYLLAAGSRAVTGIEVTGAVRARQDGRTLAVRAPEGARPGLTARLENGSSLAPVGDGASR